jgi:hypothetical protein
MSKVSPNAQRRLLIGLGTLAFVGLLELVALTAPENDCGAPDDPLVDAVVISIPVLWVIALVLLSWGKERVVWGFVRLGGLALVAVFFVLTLVDFLGDCWS